MSNPAPPAGATFDRLRSEMPAIAEAVNKFESPEIQRAAFDAFMRSLGLGTREAVPTAPAELTVVRTVPDAGAEDSDGAGPEPVSEGKARPTAARQQRPRKPGGKKSWPLDKQINFRPAGKPSLRDFADEKQPNNNDQKSAVIVYYMTEVLGMSAVNIGQVLTGYNECQWKPSSSPDATLRTTASKYRWIDTSDAKAIKLTHAGRAFVEYDLPTKKATSA